MVVRTVLWVVWLRRSREPHVLLPLEPGHLLGSDTIQGRSRDAACADGEGMVSQLALAGIQLGGSLGFPMAEEISQRSDGEQYVRRSYVVPLTSLPFTPQALSDAGLQWVPLTDIADECLQESAQTASLRAATLYPTMDMSSLRAWLEQPAMQRSGARSLRPVHRLPPLAAGGESSGSADLGWQRRNCTWKEAVATSRAADLFLRDGLLAVSSEDPAAEHLHGLADRIEPLAPDEVPQIYRQDGMLPSFADAELALQPYSQRVQPPRTKPLPPVTPQPLPPADFNPEGLQDLLLPEAYERLIEFLERLAAWLLDLDEFGEQAPSKRPQPLILSQQDFVEAARGIDWDLRDGKPVPLDVMREVNITLDRDYLWVFKPGWPDEELYDHLNGVRFKSPLPMQMVLQPHLISLSKGMLGVHKELARLGKEGWYRFFSSIPLAPWSTFPNGSTTRKLEPERPRRTTDATAPRNWSVDNSGVRVVPINVHARWSACDLARGTIEAYYARWRKLLLGDARNHEPPSFHPVVADGEEFMVEERRMPMGMAMTSAQHRLYEKLTPTEREDSIQRLESHSRGQMRPRSPVTRSSDPAAPVLRGGRSFDVECTRRALDSRFANPFKMGPRGRTHALREMAVLDYTEWLAARTVKAKDWGSALPVSAALEDLLGEDVERAIHELIDRVGHDRTFHLICGEQCYGRSCHTKALSELFIQVLESASPPPLPKELKPTLQEILNDLSVLMHVGYLIGLPVYQLTSDVKDFFNQLKLHASQAAHAGLITLDIQAMIDYHKHARKHRPNLCFVVEEVLGFGYVLASNIAQRFAYLLCFIWYCEMLEASKGLVRALRRQYPVLDVWLSERAALEPRRLAKDTEAEAHARTILRAQTRLYCMSMYTDDGHHGFVGRDLTILGAKIWYLVTQVKIKLRMAIVLKFNIGSLVTTQGVKIHSSLGLAYIPHDKRRRAQAELYKVVNAIIQEDEYESLLGFLNSLIFLAGLDRTAMYGMYAGCYLGGEVNPAALAHVTPLIKQRALEWRERLSHSAGVPFHAAVDQLVNGKGYSLPDGSFTIYLHKSDACTGEQEDTAMGRPSKAGKGDGYGGLGGSLGGRVWRFVTLPEHAAVPIAVREFAAFIVEITYEGDGIADGEDVLHIAEVDALATVDTLTTNAASSPAMQALHRFLLNHPVYRRRAARLLLAHCFGVANFISDAASRGLWELVARLCRQLDMAMERHAAPPIAAEVMDLALRLRGAGDAGSEGSTSGRATSEPIRRRVVLSTWRTRHPHKLGIRPPSGAGASAEVRCNKVLFCKAIDCYGSAIVQLGYDVEVDDKVSDGHIVKALNNWVTGVEGFYGGYLLDTEVDLLIGAIVARLHRRSHEIHAIVVRSEYQKTPARYGTRLMNELMAPLEPGTDMRIVNKSCMRTAQPFLAKYGFKFGSKATKWEDAHGVYTVPIPPQTAQAFSIDSSEDEVEVEVEDSPEPAATSAFSGGVPLVPCATPLLSSALVGGKQPMDSHAPPPPSSPQCRHTYSNQWLECPACDCPRNICDRCDHIESCFNCEYALDLETDVRLQGWRQLHPDSEEAKHLRERSPHVCKDGTTGRWARCNNGCPAQICSRCLEWRQPPLGLPCVCASRHDRPAELPYVTPNPEVDAASHDSTSTNLGLAADPVSHSDFSMAKVPHESAGDMGVDNMPFTLRVLPQLYLRQSHVRVMVQVLAEWWAFWRRICAFAHWAAALPQHCPLAAKRPRTCRCTNAHASGRTCTNVATHEDLCEGCTYASLLPSGQEICGCNCNACRLRGGAPARYQISKRAGPEPPPDWLTIFEPILLWARESAGFHGREHWNGHGQEECLRHMYYRPPPHKRDEYHRTLLHLILTLSGTCRTGRQDPVIRMYWPRESRYLERQHVAVRLTLEVSLDHLTRDWAQIIESLAHGLLVIPIRLRVLADYYSKRTLLHCVLNLSATCRRYRALPFLQQLLATERPEMEAHELFAEVERQQALLRQQQLEHQLRIETERESRRQLRISDAWERNKCDFPNWLAFRLRAHIEDVQWLLQGAFYRYVCWCINHSTVGDGGLNRDKDVAKDVVRRLYGVHSMPSACVRTDAGLETVRIPRPGDGLLAQAEYLLRWDWRAVFYFVAAIYNLEFTATAHRNMHRVRDQFDYLLYVPAAEINFALSGTPQHYESHSRTHYN